jgi:hypothetical protein
MVNSTLDEDNFGESQPMSLGACTIKLFTAVINYLLLHARVLVTVSHFHPHHLQARCYWGYF